MIYELYPVAMELGMSKVEFWDSTLIEIQEFINFRRKKELQRVKEEISRQFLLSRLVGEQLSAMYDSKVKLSMPWTIYPELFKEEEEEFLKVKSVSDLEDYKKKRFAFMQRHNEKIGKGV